MGTNVWGVRLSSCWCYASSMKNILHRVSIRIIPTGIYQLRPAVRPQRAEEFLAS